MLWECFRLSTSKDGTDVLEPLDGQGQPLLGDDGRPMTSGDDLDQLRIHPDYGFLFQQRGAMGTGAMGTGTNPRNIAGWRLWRGDQPPGDERQRALPRWLCHTGPFAAQLSCSAALPMGRWPYYLGVLEPPHHDHGGAGSHTRPGPISCSSPPLDESAEGKGSTSRPLNA